MRIAFPALARVIVDNAEGKTPAQVKTLMRDVVKLLGEAHALGAWRQLVRAIDKVWIEKYGAATITIVSAHPLTNELRAQLDEHAHGATVTEIVDDRLIAGAIIRKDNTRIDGSLTGALMRLKNAMYTEV